MNFVETSFEASFEASLTGTPIVYPFALVFGGSLAPTSTVPTDCRINHASKATAALTPNDRPAAWCIPCNTRARACTHGFGKMGSNK